MSNGTPIPATISSQFYGAPLPTVLVIGDQYYNPPDPNDESYYFMAVVDLTDLNVVASDVAGNNYLPSDITAYLGNSQYFLFCATNAVNGYDVPQGALYTFLQEVGAGPQLARAEQMIDQLGTGFITNFSYILAGTMANDDMPGFETFSFSESTVLTMQFMPITVNGQTIYAPIQSGA